MIRKGIIICLFIASAGIGWLWVWSHTSRTTLGSNGSVCGNSPRNPTIPGWLISTYDSYNAKTGHVWVCGERGRLTAQFVGYVRAEPTPTIHWESAGIRLFLREWSVQIPVMRIEFPFWMAFSVTSVIPAFAIAVGIVRRIRRYGDGQCQSCGYDLTGNVSGVCPECGKPI